MQQVILSEVHRNFTRIRKVILCSFIEFYVTETDPRRSYNTKILFGCQPSKILFVYIIIQAVYVDCITSVKYKFFFTVIFQREIRK